MSRHIEERALVEKPLSGRYWTSTSTNPPMRSSSMEQSTLPNSRLSGQVALGSTAAKRGKLLIRLQLGNF
jgi:hypothetical protein